MLDSWGSEKSVLDVDKHAIMQRFHIHARDLRVLDPLLSYPSTILARDNAILLNLEVHMRLVLSLKLTLLFWFLMFLFFCAQHIKAIITAQEVCASSRLVCMCFLLSWNMNVVYDKC